MLNDYLKFSSFYFINFSYHVHVNFLRPYALPLPSSKKFSGFFSHAKKLVNISSSVNVLGVHLDLKPTCPKYDRVKLPSFFGQTIMELDSYTTLMVCKGLVLCFWRKTFYWHWYTVEDFSSFAISTVGVLFTQSLQTRTLLFTSLVLLLVLLLLLFWTYNRDKDIIYLSFLVSCLWWPFRLSRGYGEGEKVTGLSLSLSPSVEKFLLPSWLAVPSARFLTNDPIAYLFSVDSIAILVSRVMEESTTWFFSSVLFLRIVSLFTKVTDVTFFSFRMDTAAVCSWIFSFASRFWNSRLLVCFSVRCTSISCDPSLTIKCQYYVSKSILFCNLVLNFWLFPSHALSVTHCTYHMSLIIMKSRTATSATSFVPKLVDKTLFRAYSVVFRGERRQLFLPGIIPCHIFGFSPGLMISMFDNSKRHKIGLSAMTVSGHPLGTLLHLTHSLFFFLLS